MDEVTDIAYWVDDVGTQNPNDDVPYVYVTGYQTTANGATVFATHKYFAVNGPGVVPPIFSATIPTDPTTAVGTNKAVAMALDSTTGDIYITGEVYDVVNGFQNYFTIKYDKLMVIDWFETYDTSAHLDDIPAGISFNERANVVAVTGRSRLLTDDILTLLYNASDGSSSALWASKSSKSS